MRKDKREQSVADSPALVVTYGNTSRKHRPLDADLIVLGRNPSCDFSLVSPEIAPVHCILARVADGWRLHDCSGRPGTRVNGKLVHDTLLDDGDVIQVGSFSFEVKLPPGHERQRDPDAPVVSPSLVEHLQKSRRRLVEVALKLRKRVGNRRLAVTDSEGHLVALRAELNQQAALLQSRQRDYDLRVTRLELSERDLATDRATLDKEYRSYHEDVERHTSGVRAFNEHVERVESELGQKRESLQEEIRKLREEADKRAADRSADAGTDEERQRAREKTRELEARARELDQYARHLRKLYKTSTAAAPPLSPSGRDHAADSIAASLQVHQEALAGLGGALRVQLSQATALVHLLRRTLEDTRSSQNAAKHDTATRRRVTAKKV